MNKIKIEITEVQYKNLVALIDLAQKSAGINASRVVVELMELLESSVGGSGLGGPNEVKPDNFPEVQV